MKLMRTNDSNFVDSISRSKDNSLNFEHSSIYELYVSNVPIRGDTTILNLYSIDNVILDNMIEYLREISEVRLYNKKDEFTYRQRPMLLSKHIYGFSDFWYIILAVNKYISVYEFKNFTKLLIPRKEIIEDLFNKESYKRDGLGISKLE